MALLPHATAYVRHAEAFRQVLIVLKLPSLSLMVCEEASLNSKSNSITKTFIRKIESAFCTYCAHSGAFSLDETTFQL